VAMVNKYYTKEPESMQLLWCLWFLVAHLGIDVKCRHKAGVLLITFHIITYLPSFIYIHRFFIYIHRDYITPTHIITPPSALDIGNGRTRLASRFRQLFSSIIGMV